MMNKAGVEKVIWPGFDYWFTDDFDIEDAYYEYLIKPESKVQSDLHIFVEPSIQGGRGGVFITPEEGCKYSEGYCNYEFWCDKELEMAISSSSVEEYENKFREFVISILEEK